MNKLKQWVALTVLMSLLLLVGGWFLLVSPKRSDAASLREQTVGRQASNQQLATQLARLKAQAKDLPRQQARLSAVAAKIPDGPAMPTLVRALSAAADEANVELLSVTPSAASPLTAAPAATTTATTTAASSSTAARPAAAPVSAATGTLQAMGVSLSVAGGYFEVAQFLDRLESLQRAFRVTALSIGTGANPVKASTQAQVDSGRALLTTITGQVYLAPGRTAFPATSTAK